MLYVLEDSIKKQPDNKKYVSEAYGLDLGSPSQLMEKYIKLKELKGADDKLIQTPKSENLYNSETYDITESQNTSMYC